LTPHSLGANAEGILKPKEWLYRWTMSEHFRV
jgi:hypothetical protein